MHGHLNVKVFSLLQCVFSEGVVADFFVFISGMSSFILRLTLATKQQNSCQSKLCVQE